MKTNTPKVNNFELYFPKSDTDKFDIYEEPLRYYYFCLSGSAIYIKRLREKNQPYAVCCNFNWSKFNVSYLDPAKVLYKTPNLIEAIKKFKYFVKEFMNC